MRTQLIRTPEPPQPLGDQVETKSHFVNSGTSFYSFLESSGKGNVLAAEALRYFDGVAPVSIAVEKITEPFADLDLVISDCDGFTSDHALLEFMKNPNSDQTQTEFLEAYAIFYVVTGNSFMMTTGSMPNRPPAELTTVGPQFVQIHENPADGYVGRYEVSTGRQGATRTIFKREEEKRFRFFADEKTMELYQVRRFSSGVSRGRAYLSGQTNNRRLWGSSKLAAIFSEIEQYCGASTHNLSLLGQGAKLSGVLMVDGVLSDPDFRDLEQQIREFHSGAENAGNTLILQSGLGTGGSKTHWQDMTAKNKDMDFRQLKKDNETTIFGRLNIPLALMSTEAMTLNNLSTANVMLHENAVSPLADRLLQELTLFLAPRFDLKPNERITYDPQTVAALRSRRLAEVEQISKIGIETDNEMRARIGDEETEGDEGNVLWKSSLLSPVSSDKFNDDGDSKGARAKFFELMEGRGYTREELEAVATKNGLPEE